MPETADWTWRLVGESLIANRMVIRNRHPVFAVRVAAMVLRSMTGPKTRLHHEATSIMLFTLWGKEASPHKMRAHLVGSRKVWRRRNPHRAL